METQITQHAINALEIELEAIQGLRSRIDKNFVEAVQSLYQCKGRIVISGIGKSGIIAQKISATFNSTGTPSLFMHASDAIHGDLGMIRADDLAIIISKSGESPEIKVLVPLIKKLGVPLMAITGNRQSFLAQQAAFCIDTTIEREACPNNLAPTSSTTAQLVMGDILAVCLIKLKHFSSNDFAKFHPGGNIGKRLFMRVSDIYPKNERPYVYMHTPLKDVILSITRGRQGATAVIDEKGHLLGVITDGDVRRMLEKTDNLTNIVAENLTTLHPKHTPTDTLALDAMDLLKKHNVNQLLVTDKEYRYMGIIHIHDLLKEGFS